MATLIKTNGAMSEVFPQDGESFTLKELHDLVANPIDMVKLDEGSWMVVDDEGLLKELPLNKFATQIYQTYIATDNYIVGDILIGTNKELN